MTDDMMENSKRGGGSAGSSSNTEPEDASPESEGLLDEEANLVLPAEPESGAAQATEQQKQGEIPDALYSLASKEWPVIFRLVSENCQTREELANLSAEVLEKVAKSLGSYAAELWENTNAERYLRDKHGLPDRAYCGLSGPAEEEWRSHHSQLTTALVNTASALEDHNPRLAADLYLKAPNLFRRATDQETERVTFNERVMNAVLELAEKHEQLHPELPLDVYDLIQINHEMPHSPDSLVPWDPLSSSDARYAKEKLMPQEQFDRIEKSRKRILEFLRKSSDDELADEVEQQIEDCQTARATALRLINRLAEASDDASINEFRQAWKDAFSWRAAETEQSQSESAMLTGMAVDYLASFLTGRPPTNAGESLREDHGNFAANLTSWAHGERANNRPTIPPEEVEKFKDALRELISSRHPGAAVFMMDYNPEEDLRRVIENAGISVTYHNAELYFPTKRRWVVNFSTGKLVKEPANSWGNFVVVGQTDPVVRAKALLAQHRQLERSHGRRPDFDNFMKVNLSIFCDRRCDAREMGQVISSLKELTEDSPQRNLLQPVIDAAEALQNALLAVPAERWHETEDDYLQYQSEREEALGRAKNSATELVSRLVKPTRTIAEQGSNPDEPEGVEPTLQVLIDLARQVAGAKLLGRKESKEIAAVAFTTPAEFMRVHGFDSGNTAKRDDPSKNTPITGKSNSKNLLSDAVTQLFDDNPGPTSLLQ